MNKIWGSIRNKFLAGIVILGPLGFTVLVLKWIFNFFDGFLGPYLRRYFDWYVPGMGIVLTLIVVYIIGIIGSNYISRKPLEILDKILARIPLVKSIYNTAKGIFEAFSKQGKSSFQKVVLIQYPRKGLWTLAFVTGTTLGDDGKEYYSMFVPSTPNPTTGYVLFMIKDDVTETKISVEQGLKILISGGMAVPEKMRLGQLPERSS